MNQQQQDYAAMETGIEHLKIDNGNTPYDRADDGDEEPLSTTRNHPTATATKSALATTDTVQMLYECYTNKVYFGGYVERKLNNQWSQWYAELRGAILAFWESKDQPPQCLSVADASSVEVLKINDESNNEERNVFVINSASMQHIIRTQQQEEQWVGAIRLSCFELSKLQEFLTRQLLTQPTYVEQLKQTMTKMEGWVQVRFSNSTEWKKFWVTVSDRKDEKKLLFGRKAVSSRGQMMFSETKKAKPVMTIVNVVQASIVYPESANILKVEGSTLSKSSANPGSSGCCWVYIMTENQRDLVQWCLGTFDAFKLYGRPSRLLNDPTNISALNFGEPPHGNMPGLFLDLPETSHINVKDETLLENKAQFTGVLYSKIKQSEMQRQPQQQTAGPINKIPNGSGIYNAPSNNNSAILASQASSQKTSIYSNQSAVQSNQLSAQVKQGVNKGRVTYASDEDSDDDDNEDDEDDDDKEDDSDSEQESVLGNLNQKSKDSLLLPSMSAMDDGFASSILGGLTANVNTSKTSLNSQHQQLQMQQQQRGPLPVKSNSSKKTAIRANRQQDSDQSSDDESDLSESEEEEEEGNKELRGRDQLNYKTNVTRPKPKIARTQVSLSGSDDDEDDYHNGERASFSGSEDEDNTPIGHQSTTHLNEQVNQRMMQQPGQWEHGMTPDMYVQHQDGMMMQQQIYYDEQGNAYYPSQMFDEDGPIIPQLGDRFATQNSLLDTFRPDYPSARDQEGYARSMGQPLIQVPNKPPEPRTGLVGMISQIEYDKKQKDANKIRINGNSNVNVNNMDREMLMERERERYLIEQRAQMMQSQPIMNQGMMNQGMMNQGMINQGMMNQGMVDPRMMDPRMVMPMMGNQMPMMMGNQVPMMNMMQNQSMLQNQNMMQQSMNMMNMMDPRMSMMMMQQYGQYPMWQQGIQAGLPQAMYGNFNLQQGAEEEDEDDDLPLGAKDSPRQKTQ